MEIPQRKIPHKPPRPFVQKKLVLVDALNFSMRLLGLVKQKRWPHPLQMKKKIEKFVKAARASNLQLEIFIDAAIITGDTLKTWKERREKEVKKGNRGVPQGTNILLGEMFASFGIPVHYSAEADCDDTIISHAIHRCAEILSGDGDMFEYGEAILAYSGYSYNRGKLVLIKSPNYGTFIKSRLKPLDHIADTIQIPKKFSLQSLKDSFYLRGSPSPLTRHCGNLHRILSPLRQAMYHKLGIKSNIEEEFPEWDESKSRVSWTKIAVTPNDSLSHLFENPQQAIDYFAKKHMKRPEGVDSDDWYNHCYAFHVVIFEMFAEVTDHTVVGLLEKTPMFANAQPQSENKRGGMEVICVKCSREFFVSPKFLEKLKANNHAIPKRCNECKVPKGKR
jgi:hypothetical protein